MAADYFKAKTAGTEITFDMRGYTKNLIAAREWLKDQMVADCSRFVPFQRGGLRSSVVVTNQPYGFDIEWNTPYAHYLYEGEVYVNPKTMKSGYIGRDGMWHGWRGKKIPSGRPIMYHTAGTGDHWIEKARDAYGKTWQAGLRKIATR